MITPDEFRRAALSLPETEERAHMNHPDFRVAGKIFATLGPDETWGMVKLTPEQQASLVNAAPQAFSPASGAWGRGGATIVQLRHAKKTVVRQALLLAWRRTAPSRLVSELDEK